MTNYANMILKWTCHGVTNCPKCQALNGVTKPIGEWQIQPGFHPNCDCTLDLVAWEEYNQEPVLFVSITSYFIVMYGEQFNPVKSTKPALQFPLCPFISNLAQSARLPESIVPAPAATIPRSVFIPIPTSPPKPYVDTSLKRFG